MESGRKKGMKVKGEMVALSIIDSPSMMPWMSQLNTINIEQTAKMIKLPWLQKSMPGTRPSTHIVSARGVDSDPDAEAD